MITNREMVYKIAELFDKIELTTTEVDAALREAGYDPDEVRAKMKAIADEALAKGICCITLKEWTCKSIPKERVIAFDRAIFKSDVAVITKLRNSCHKME